MIRAVRRLRLGPAAALFSLAILCASSPPAWGAEGPHAAPAPAVAASPGVPLTDVPPLPEGTVLFDQESRFGKRGQQGGYAAKPSRYGIWTDARTVRPDGAPQGATAVRYKKVPGPSFCGVYTILLGDLSPYATMTFWIKGAKGGETFEIGMNDTVSNKREDAVMVGSIHRYLPQGITTEWQQVVVPLVDFFGPDLRRVYSIVFNFNEEGEGKLWMEGLAFHTEALVDRETEILNKGELFLDNFDHSDLNLLGRKANAFKRLPSVCEYSRVPEPRHGDTGRSLRLDFNKQATGWCGYYTLVKAGPRYLDATPYKAITFWVKGAAGGENFVIGVADKHWEEAGDSVKSEQIGKYLSGGKITAEWQKATVPLSVFLVEMKELASIAVCFEGSVFPGGEGKGTVYLDDLTLE